MFALTPSQKFYLYNYPCSMILSFDGLSDLIRRELGQSPTNGSVFIFINKSRTSLKVLTWQNGGFMIYYKRLEKGTFDIPKYDPSVKSFKLTYTQLVLLIDGIPITNLSRKKPRYNLSTRSLAV